MLQHTFDGFGVIVADEEASWSGSADDPLDYAKHYHLGPCDHVTSGHSVRVEAEGREIATCLLTASGGATGVHEHTVIGRPGTLFVAVGPFVVSLGLPSLDLNWATQTDDATCFGVHELSNKDGLLSHGELAIARLSYTGTIVWEAGGADIFTNGFTVHRTIIEAIDFNDRNYVFDIETGCEVES